MRLRHTRQPAKFETCVVKQSLNPTFVGCKYLFSIVDDLSDTGDFSAPTPSVLARFVAMKMHGGQSPTPSGHGGPSAPSADEQNATKGDLEASEMREIVGEGAGQGGNKEGSRERSVKGGSREGSIKGFEKEGSAKGGSREGSVKEAIKEGSIESSKEGSLKEGVGQGPMLVVVVKAKRPGLFGKSIEIGRAGLPLVSLLPRGAITDWFPLSTPGATNI